MNDRLKFRVWDKRIKTYISIKHTWFTFDGVLQCGNEQIIEQCTGFKDIFDGDKLSVLYPGTVIKLTGIVTWHNYKWVVEFDDCSRLSFDDMVKEQWDIEITGTIHDKETG